MFITFVFISLIMGIISILYIRKYDIYEKEPISKMLIATIVGGICSVVTTTNIYILVEFLGFSNIETSLGALLIVGPAEEISKLIGLVLVYQFIEKDFTEPIDGLIYMSCVALGFSLIENFSYALLFQNVESMIFIRFLFVTPAHILFSVYMGLAFFYYVKIQKNLNFLFFSFLYSSILHGIWDLIAFNGFWFILFLIIINIAYIQLIKWLEYTTAKSPYRISITKFIKNYKNPTMTNGIECLNCGSKNQKLTYKLNRILIQKCDYCNCYVTNYNSIFYIFHYFGSKFENLSNHLLLTNTEKNYYSIIKNNYISKDKKIAFFYLQHLNKTLEDININCVKNFENRKIIRGY